jgi:hypothetical protein
MLVTFFSAVAVLLLEAWFCIQKNWSASSEAHAHYV